MNTVEHFTRLFAYDGWANQEVLTGLQAAPLPPARSLQFIAHILASEHLWLERLEGNEQTLPVWPDFTTAELANLAADLTQSWKTYLAARNEDDLGQRVSYRNSKGEAWSSRKDDILMHVVMH